MQTTEMLLFVYGSMSRGMVHFDKIANYVVDEVAGTTTGQAYRLQVGYPVVVRQVDGGAQRISGHVLRLQAPDLVYRLLDEFHGYAPMTPDKSLYLREVVAVETEDGRTVEANIYVMNPAKLPKGAEMISDGDWARDFNKRSPMTVGLSDRQREYVMRLNRATGREVVPIDMVLYRELIKLELIVDKGRRLALTKFGKEVARYLS